MGYNTENGATLEEITNFRKKEEGKKGKRKKLSLRKRKEPEGVEKLLE